MSLVLLLGLVVVVGLLWSHRPGAGTGDHRQGALADRDDALRILRRRLAEGEIDLEEYERLRRAVES